MHIEFCAKLNFLEGEYAIMQNIGFFYHGSVTHAGISSYGLVKYERILWMSTLRERPAGRKSYDLRFFFIFFYFPYFFFYYFFGRVCAKMGRRRWLRWPPWARTWRFGCPVA